MGAGRRPKSRLPVTAAGVRAGAHCATHEIVGVLPPGLHLPQPLPEQPTLLDLVAAVSEVARGEDETVSIVRNLLDSGRVRLRGQFRGIHLRAKELSED